MKNKFYLWIEDYLFCPNFFQRTVSFILLPFSFIYILIVLSKRLLSKKNNFNIPIVSIGNLIVGGSGKTPITIELAKNFENPCIVLRGYKRNSKGLVVVSLKGKINVDVYSSGDEAMLLAKSIKNSTVIVSENRIDGILKAKEFNCEVVFLDDGFSKYNINKFDILIKPKDEPKNIFCLPSGAYREPKIFYKKANLVLKEDFDFYRKVLIKKDNKETNLPKNCILLTSISKPKRLLKYLPHDVKLVSFPDHHYFTKQDIDYIITTYNSPILVTEKDFVKLEKFNLDNLYIMNLYIFFNENVDFSSLNDFIKNFN